MEEAGEGNVVYFSDVNSGKCLSLGKLKTIDCNNIYNII